MLNYPTMSILSPLRYSTVFDHNRYEEEPEPMETDDNQTMTDNDAGTATGTMEDDTTTNPTENGKKRHEDALDSGDEDTATKQPTKKKKQKSKKITLPFEKYKKISNLLVMHLKKHGIFPWFHPLQFVTLLQKLVYPKLKLCGGILTRL